MDSPLNSPVTAQAAPTPSPIGYIAQRYAARDAAMVQDLAGLDSTGQEFKQALRDSLWPLSSTLVEAGGIELNARIDHDGVYHWTLGRVSDPIEFEQLWGLPVTHARAHQIAIGGLLSLEHQRDAIEQIDRWVDRLAELPHYQGPRGIDEMPDLAIAVLRGRE